MEGIFKPWEKTFPLPAIKKKNGPGRFPVREFFTLERPRANRFGRIISGSVRTGFGKIKFSFSGRALPVFLDFKYWWNPVQSRASFDNFKHSQDSGPGRAGMCRINIVRFRAESVLLDLKWE